MSLTCDISGLNLAGGSCIVIPVIQNLKPCLSNHKIELDSSWVPIGLPIPAKVNEKEEMLLTRKDVFAPLKTHYNTSDLKIMMAKETNTCLANHNTLPGSQCYMGLGGEQMYWVHQGNINLVLWYHIHDEVFNYFSSVGKMKAPDTYGCFPTQSNPLDFCMDRPSSWNLFKPFEHLEDFFEIYYYFKLGLVFHNKVITKHQGHYHHQCHVDYQLKVLEIMMAQIAAKH
jgi:hypothetical protein